MGNNIFDAGVASAYDETLPSHISLHYLKKRVSFFFRYIKPYAKVLDVGCGTGGNLAWLSKFGKVTGVDSSETAIDLANSVINLSPSPFGGGVREGVFI